jgi:hypothetical protein
MSNTLATVSRLLVQLAAAPPPVEAAEAVEPVDAQAEEKPKRELEFEPGVMVWLRGQARHNQDYAEAGPDAVDLLSRLRLQALLRWRFLSVFAQAQDHRQWGSRTEPNASGALGFHQGWFELAGKRGGDLSGSIRVGRQEIGWGKHRLIGTFPWGAGGRSFDAVRLQGQARWAGLELMYAIIERPRNFDVTDASTDPPMTTSVHTRGVHLAAARLSATPHEAINVELMSLLDYADASPTELDRKRMIGDVGARVWGEPVADVLTYDVEAHGQFGRQLGLEHRAWAVASTVRVQAPPTAWHPDVVPGVQLGYAIASGHACTGTTECAPTQSNDFYNFYPTNHPHYGILDQFGWSNMRDAEAGLFVKKGDVIEASVIYHSFQMHQPGGRWRDSGGNLVGAGWDLDEQSRTLGHEIDFLVTAKLWKPLWLQPGYGMFIPTAAGSRLAGPDTQHFVFLWIVVELAGPVF